MKVFLSGEGSDELGDWCNPPQHRSSPPRVGIIEALLRKLGVVDLEVRGTLTWHTIRKFRFKPAVRGEVHNVLALAVDAQELGAEVLVFVRDRDRYPDRQVDVEEGITQALARGYVSEIVGGVAVQEIEAWILALLGERRSEQHKDAKSVLQDRHGLADREAKVAAVEGADLGHIPEDAESLHVWLKRATDVFTPSPAGTRTSSRSDPAP